MYYTAPISPAIEITKNYQSRKGWGYIDKEFELNCSLSSRATNIERLHDNSP